MLKTLRGRRVKVTGNLNKVTSIDRDAEVAPLNVGVKPERVDAIWTAVEQLYETGIHPAITLVLRKQGQIVMKRSIGAVRGTAPGERGPRVALDPDAPISLFSASKAISALLLHKLVEMGELRLEDKVAKHIPKFASHGKDKVTIRQLLAHRAGIPMLPINHPDPDLLRHWDAIVDILCSAPPSDDIFQKQAYHALTAGFIVGELVRRISGRDLRDLLREWIAEPLGCKYLTYGLAPELRELSPPNVFTGPKPIWPLTLYTQRILGVTFMEAVDGSNSDAFMSGIVPAGNIFASADDASRVFQMLLNGGVWEGKRIFEEKTVREAIRPVGPRQVDGVLRIPIRYSAGFMLGENPFGLYGSKCDNAFGHLGFVSVLCWADPSRDMSVALLNTGKSIDPVSVLRLARVLGAISRACPQQL